MSCHVGYRGGKEAASPGEQRSRKPVNTNEDMVYHNADHCARPRSLPIYARWPWALGDLISLLNTGAVQGKALTKRRADFDKVEWRAALEALFHEIRELRGLYASLVKSGEIDEDKCTCGFRNNSMCQVFDRKKQAIIEQMNALLTDANLPMIRPGYGDEH